MAAGSFKFKTLMILSFLLIWAVVAAAHVFYYAVVKREESLKETRRIAWREAEIPSLRGRILDKNGVPAAWSELRHNLVLEKIPESRRRRDNLFRGIRRFFPEHELPHPMKLPLLLKNDLSPEEIVFYSRRLRNYPELRIVPVIRRVVVGTPEIQSQIGKTALNDAGEAVGVSGLEREYDLELSGTSGRMTVMLDRNGNWCYDTLRITRQAKNGEDIRADFELPPETDASKELPEDETD